ncbi:hypothetical protein GCM10020219_076990 [Nonomuraea dietziae]
MTCPTFSAISAITTGSTSTIADTSKTGPCRVGRPIQSAWATASKFTLKCSVTFPSPPGAVIIPPVLSHSHDSANPKTRPSNTPILPRKPRKTPMKTKVATIVMSATHGSCGQ